MYIAHVTVAALLTLLLLVSGTGKLRKNSRTADGLAKLGVPPGMLPFLAACNVAGAAGLVAGIWWPPLGIAATVGVVLYFVGAVTAHLRKQDFKGVPGAAFALGLAAAALLLGFAAG